MAQSVEHIVHMLHKYPNVIPIPGSKNQGRILENLGIQTYNHLPGSFHRGALFYFLISQFFPVRGTGAFTGVVRRLFLFLEAVEKRLESK